MIRYGYVDTPNGQVHFAECGSGEPIVCLHQTPRSVDEFTELLPRLGRRAVALDTAGFGGSSPVAEMSIETLAEVVVAALDALGIERTALLGHHTGGVIAVEVAARHPDRVSALILSSTPYVDAAARVSRRTRPPIDEVAPAADGSHLTELWNRRAWFYPAGRGDILARFVIDALRAGPRLEEGHRAVSRYRMEEATPLITAPTLLIGASADQFAYPELEPLRAAITGAEVAVVEGGMVPLMEEHHEQVAEIVRGFLDR